MRASFLPGPGTPRHRQAVGPQLHVIDLSDSAVLETGCVYIVPLLESMALPKELAAATNPKSSTGRLDVFTRVIADGVGSFDQIPAGYHGPLYAEICPQTFPIVVRKGSRLSQIRFRVGAVQDDDLDLIELHQREQLVSSDQADIARGIALSVDLAGDDQELVGYRAKRHTGLVDVDAPGSCAVLDYWEPIRVSACAAPDPRSGSVLHPGVQGGRARAADACGRNGAVQSSGGRVPRALRRLLRSGLRPCRGRRRRSEGRAGGAQPQGAVRPGGRADRRAA